MRAYRFGDRAAPIEQPSPAQPQPLPLPHKPSIAVLPFTNMSGDPEQGYFVDGMVEEIITALSCIRWLFVIARNSSFSYKVQSPDVRQVGRELGVRYVLEGSVRKAGNRVRITGQPAMPSRGRISGSAALTAHWETSSSSLTRAIAGQYPAIRTQVRTRLAGGGSRIRTLGPGKDGRTGGATDFLVF